MMTSTGTTTFSVDEVTPTTESLPEVSTKEAIDILVRPSSNLLDAYQTQIEETKRELEEAQRNSITDPERVTELTEHFARLQKGLAANPARSPVEACHRYTGRLVEGITYHPLVAALQLAYVSHRPISLSPDMVWLLICQGVAHHINVNAEHLRSRFVHHDGRIELMVRRDDFHMGSPENPWPEVFDDLARQAQQHLRPNAIRLFAPRFSTTGPVERVVADIVLLGAAQSYFKYGLMRIICGIPEITLEGTVQDWEAIRNGIDEFSELDLDWWLRPLRPILDQFAKAAGGHVDQQFWRCIYRFLDGNCGRKSSSATGWVTALFPYLCDAQGQPTRRNPWLAREKSIDELDCMLYHSGPIAEEIDEEIKLRDHKYLRGMITTSERGYQGKFDGVYETEFPGGLTKAPFSWQYLNPNGNELRRRNMEFLGGFVGVAQDPETLCLRPEIGWAVRASDARD